MQKIQKRIEILRSLKKSHSSLSLPSAYAIQAELAQHFSDVVITHIDSLIDLYQLAERHPDLAFMGLSSVHDDISGQTIWVSTYLEQCGISHTGSSENALVLEKNKALAKQRVLDQGLVTSPYFVIKNGIPYLDASMLLEFPLFVKPTNLGGGSGVDNNSVVHSYADLRTKSNSISSNHSADSLVEQYLSGREFSVAVLKEEFSDKLIAMPLEIVTTNNSRGDRILSQTVKALNEEEAIAVIDPVIHSELSIFAINVFRALGARDYGRIDIRMDGFGVPHFLEANLIPSLINNYGNFPKACALNLGMDYSTMLLHIVQLGLAEHSPSAALTR